MIALNKPWYFKAVLLLIFTLFSCVKPAQEEEEMSITNFEAGILVANLGSEQNGIASVSYYHRKNGEVINELFRQENNGKAIGNSMESMSVYQGKVYLVSEDRLEVVELKSFKALSTVTGFELPRYFLGINANKAYVSDWGDGANGKIRVVDLVQNKVINTIETNTRGPEQMLLKGDRVYVTNSGGFLSDNRISIIDVNSDRVLSHFEVGVDPINILEDATGKIWVLSKGFIDSNNPSNSQAGRLSQIENDREVFQIELSNTARSLACNANRDVLYFVMDGWIYDFPINSTKLKQAPFVNKFCFRLGVDPQTDHLFCSDPKNYNQDGAVVIYDSGGKLLESFDAGLVPGGYYFSE